MSLEKILEHSTLIKLSHLRKHSFNFSYSIVYFTVYLFATIETKNLIVIDWRLFCAQKKVYYSIF